MVNDTTLTVEGGSRTFAVRTFDGTSVTRSYEHSDTEGYNLSVSHETTKTGVTRSIVRLDHLETDAENKEYLASAYLVLTYQRAVDRAVAQANASAIMAWLTASTNANLISVAQKSYGG